MKTGRLAFFLLLVVAVGCSGQEVAHPGEDTVPTTTDLAVVGAPEEAQVTTDQKSIAEPITLEAFGFRIHFDEIFVEWLNEDWATIDGVGEIENIDLGETVAVVDMGWVWQCEGADPNDIPQSAIYGGIQGGLLDLASQSIPGADPQWTYVEDFEPLTSSPLIMPTTGVPVTAIEAGEFGCSDIEMAMHIGVYGGNAWSRGPAPDGWDAGGSSTDPAWIVVPVDVDELWRRLGPFDNGENLALAELCDALIGQDLEALYGEPVDGWEVDGWTCDISGTTVLVSNSESASSDYLRWPLTAMDPVSGADAVFVSPASDGSSHNAGIVVLPDVIVYFRDPNLGHGQFVTLGRLIERVATQILLD